MGGGRHAAAVVAATTAVLAALLAFAGPAHAIGAPPSETGEASAAGAPASAGITLTTQNDGREVSLLDSAHPAWAHPASISGPTAVSARFVVPTPAPRHWSILLEVQNAAGDSERTSCNDTESDTVASCVVGISVSVGVNRVTVTAAADGAMVGSATGSIRGGVLAATAGYQVVDATGQWTAVPRDQALTLQATTQSALRYIVTNTGTIPLHVIAACEVRDLQPRQRMVCVVAGIRPAQSFAGDYRQRLTVRDLVGGTQKFDIRGGVTTFAGSFVLSMESAAVGQQIVVSSQGLPQDGPFGVQYRLDDQAVPVGTSTTRAGSLRYGFVLRGVSPGPAHLNIEHDGVTIASLPFEVTRTRAKPDGASAPWGLLALPVAAVVVSVLLWRRRTARALSPDDPD